MKKTAEVSANIKVTEFILRSRVSAYRIGTNGTKQLPKSLCQRQIEDECNKEENKQNQRLEIGKCPRGNLSNDARVLDFTDLLKLHDPFMQEQRPRPPRPLQKQRKPAEAISANISNNEQTHVEKSKNRHLNTK